MATKVFFTIDQGADLNKTIHKELGVDMSGYIGVCNLKAHHKSETRITINVSFNANGDVKVAAESAQTSYIKPGRYVYDIIASNDDGNTYSRVVEGYADVIATPHLPQQLEPITIPRGVFGNFSVLPADVLSEWTNIGTPVELVVGEVWPIPVEFRDSYPSYIVENNSIILDVSGSTDSVDSLELAYTRRNVQLYSDNHTGTATIDQINNTITAVSPGKCALVYEHQLYPLGVNVRTGWYSAYAGRYILLNITDPGGT